ncbi:hypothetical protein BC828DRAFT_403261 [Blastocladiella britannica]|nr:hypothetical protein BC828DRAFT_403261 [Blastocladiella britannica]
MPPRRKHATTAAAATINHDASALAASLASHLDDLATNDTHRHAAADLARDLDLALSLAGAGAGGTTTAGVGAAVTGHDDALAALFAGTEDPLSPTSAASAAATATAARIARERRKLLTPTHEDSADLQRDLSARIDAGRGECVLEIGVLDDEDGSSLKLTDAELTAAHDTLQRIASTHLGADVTYIGEKTANHTTLQTFDALLPTTATATAATSAEDGTATVTATIPPPPVTKYDSANRCAYFLVRRQPAKVEDIMEVRVAVCGNVDAGKSTMLGVLTRNALDNGRGKARAVLFKHKHELDTGRTSSLGMECMGFDSRGRQVGVVANPVLDVAGAPLVAGAPADADESAATIIAGNGLSRKIGWDEIVQASAKVITYIDLAGHEKYLKTTMFGLAGAAPDFSCLMVGANMGAIGMTKEHLGLCLALNVPVMIVVTKIDMCPANVLEATLKQLLKILKSPGCRKIPMFVRDMEDAVRVCSAFVSDRICPIFLVSNVTGMGLPVLRHFLNLLPLMTKYDTTKPVEYQITETFSVPGVGTVVSGTLLSGTVHVGDTVLLGPDKLGVFVPTQVKGIHIKRCPVPVASAGHSASFALKRIKRAQLRKGMVLVSPAAHPVAVREFEAEVMVLLHQTTIATKYQAMLHAGNVRQTVALVDMNTPVLRSGERALVRFKFLSHPEYIREGSRVLFREGRTKGVGKITKVYPPGEVIPTYTNSPLLTTNSNAANGASGSAVASSGATSATPHGSSRRSGRNPASASGGDVAATDDGTVHDGADEPPVGGAAAAVLVAPVAVPAVKARPVGGGDSGKPPGSGRRMAKTGPKA